MGADADRRPFAEVTLARDAARAVVSRGHAHALCAGHFPGDPLIPGAYLAELMADLAARLVAARSGAAGLGTIVRCVFLARVAPDDDVVVTARLAPGERGAVEAEVRAGDAAAARATLRFGPFP
jgi:3-hydroxymyristoyl/3-hydroxydecanoyl-(acyl carrier protein) dehydratase